MKKYQYLNALGLIMMSTLVGCGGKFDSNPTAKYGTVHDGKPIDCGNPSCWQPEVKYVVQEKAVYPKPQSYVKSDIYDITVDSAQFIEGQVGSVLIQPRIFKAGIIFNLTAEGLPDGAKIENVSSSDKPNLWKLTWPVPVGFISRDKAEAEVKYQLKLNITKYPDAETESWLKAISMDGSFSFKVARITQRPSIVEISKLRELINEGDEFDFDVVVDVPGSTPDTPPTLSAFYDRSAVNVKSQYYEEDGTRYVFIPGQSKPMAPVWIGNGRWSFANHFAAKDLAPQRTKQGDVVENAPGLSVRMSFVAKSYYLQQSTPTTVQRVILYSNVAAAPQIYNVEEELGSKISGGQKYKISFAVYTANQRGVTSLEELNELPSSDLKASCKAVKSNKWIKHCELTWSVPCLGERPKKQTLTLIAKNVVGPNSAQSKLVKEVSIEENSIRCEHKKGK